MTSAIIVAKICPHVSITRDARLPRFLRTCNRLSLSREAPIRFAVGGGHTSLRKRLKPEIRAELSPRRLRLVAMIWKRLR